MRGLAAAGQLLGQRHLVEVEGRVQAALAHLQLVAQGVDALPGCKEGPQGKKKRGFVLKQGVSTQTHSVAKVSNLDKVAGQHFEKASSRKSSEPFNMDPNEFCFNAGYGTSKA